MPRIEQRYQNKPRQFHPPLPNNMNAFTPTPHVHTNTHKCTCTHTHTHTRTHGRMHAHARTHTRTRTHTHTHTNQQYSLDLELLQGQSGGSSVEEDGDEDDDKRRSQEQLSHLGASVTDGESEGNGATKTFTNKQKSQTSEGPFRMTVQSDSSLYSHFYHNDLYFAIRHEDESPPNKQCSILSDRH